MSNIFVNDGNPTLFIKDILQSPKVSETDAPTANYSWFLFKNMYYNKVHVRGVITQVQLFEDKWKMIIDDGTGALKCTYKLPDQLKKSVEQTRKMIQDIEAEGSDLDRSQANQAALMLCRHSLNMWRDCTDDFKLGETLEVIGSISEYGGSKYFYIWNITRDKFNDMDKEVAFSQRINDFYATLKTLPPRPR